MSSSNIKSDELYKRLQLIQTQALIGFFDIGIVTNNTFWSDEFCNIYRTSKEYNLEQFLDSLADKNRDAIVDSILKSTENKDLEGGTTIKIISDKGVVKYVYNKFQFTYDNDNKLEQISGWVQDITQHASYFDLLRGSCEISDSSNTPQLSLLANISHDIRTPLSAITGLSEILADESLPEIEKDEIKKLINTNSNNLFNLIGDIIGVTRVEDNKESVLFSEFDLHELFKNIEKIFADVLKESNAKNLVNSIVDIDKQMQIVSDRNRLLQVLSSFINNSMQYTSSGNIEIGYKTFDENLLNLFVRDNGDVIPKSIIPNFFELDNDGEGQKHHRYDVNFSTLQNIAEKLGGKVWVESDEVSGTCFNFTIPYNRISVSKTIPSKKKSKNIDWSDKNIMVVEDTVEVSKFIQMILRKTKINDIYAYTGNEALAMFHKNHHKLDLILLDIKLPEVDGNELLSIFKEINPNIPIIAQTAYALIGDRDNYLKRGFDEYISKPLKRDDLMRKLSRFLSK